MHETGLAKKIASLAASHADSHGLTAAGVIRVRVGVWTCADPEHLQHDVQALRPDNAPRLEIEIVEPRCVCEECGSEFSPAAFQLTCESCGSRRVTLVDGLDLEVETVELRRSEAD